MNQEEKEMAAQKVKIESGTFLRSYCPYCERSLIENNHIKFTVVKKTGEKGTLLLSPFLNVFKSSSDIEIPNSETVREIKCPHCTKNLILKDQTCPRCGSETAMITVAAMSKMIDFHLCSKKGCTWHGLSSEDLQDIILEDSEEW